MRTEGENTTAGQWESYECLTKLKGNASNSKGKKGQMDIRPYAHNEQVNVDMDGGRQKCAQQPSGVFQDEKDFLHRAWEFV